jgi:hypothetical protein
MTNMLDAIARTIAIGAGATLTMDLWAALLRKLGIPSLDFGLLGRWIGYLPEGRIIHSSIAKAPPVRGERALGWAAHYAIGISFAALLLATFGLAWAHAPTLAPALAIGLVTVIAPLFVLQPAMGAGIASSKTPRPLFNSVKSIVTHTVYGFGLYASALLTASVSG